MSAFETALLSNLRIIFIKPDVGILMTDDVKICNILVVWHMMFEKNKILMLIW
jgi:hypothetical protein